MAKSIYRKKIIDRASSPDKLDEYIKVSSPGAWLVLGGIVAALVALVIWACMGTLTERVNAPLMVQDGQATLYIPESDANRVSSGVSLTAGDATGTVEAIADVPSSVDEVRASGGDWAATSIGGSQWAYPAQVEISVPDGVYDASVTVDYYRPIDLLFGG